MPGEDASRGEKGSEGDRPGGHDRLIVHHTVLRRPCDAIRQMPNPVVQIPEKQFRDRLYWTWDPPAVTWKIVSISVISISPDVSGP